MTETSYGVARYRNGEIPECLHQNHVFAVRVNEKYMLTEYLSYSTAPPVGRVLLRYNSKEDNKFSKYKFDNNSAIHGSCAFAGGSEQKIVEMLNQKCASINEIIDEKQKLIDDLTSLQKVPEIPRS